MCALGQRPGVHWRRALKKMQTSPHNDLVLTVADLVDRPGTSRPLHLMLPAPDGLMLPLSTLTGPIRLDGVLESVVDGLLVRGVLVAPLELSCARCLNPITDDLTTEVAELFVDPQAAHGDEVEPGYEIRDAAVILDSLVRDALAVALPFAPLCRADCGGLCPACGANRNETSCACSDLPSGTRWTVLEGLHLTTDAGLGAPPA